MRIYKLEHVYMIFLQMPSEEEGACWLEGLLNFRFANVVVQPVCISKFALRLLLFTSLPA